MKYIKMLFFAVLLHSVVVSAQKENTDTSIRSHDKIKKGWNLGALPISVVSLKYKFTTTNPEAPYYLSKGSSETWHQSYGAGLYAVMNQNFIVALNYGIAANSKDGDNGLNIGLDFMF